MSVADRLNKLTTDITNAYTSIENKGGTIPANKNTNNLPTAIDSIEVIESATAEGESLSLANTKAMPYSDYVVKGKSEQATRSGKNLCKITGSAVTGISFVDSEINITGTFNENIWQPFNAISLQAGTYTFSFSYDFSNGTYFIFNSQQVFADLKKLTISINQATNIGFGLVLFAGTYNNNTIKVQIEQGSTATSYEPYGVSPSPDYPSEIHSVADDVNLFDKTKVTSGWLNQSGQIESSSNYVVSDFIEVKEGEKYYIPNRGTTRTKYYKSDKTVYSNIWDVSDVAQVINIPSEVKYIRFSILINGTNAIDINTFKFQKSTEATPYSPYNQGTVTIKQRGKNLFDIANIISSVTDYTITVQDGGFIIRTGGMSNGRNLGLLKNLCPQLKVGDKFKFNWDTNATRNNSDVNYIYLNLYANTIRKDITYTCTQEMLDSETYFYGQQGEYYKDIIFYLDGQTSDYEPYQTPHDYTFQTEPLRSLPNGVKDTIEADGIHRRVGRIVLNGSENWGTVGNDRYYITISNKRSVTEYIKAGLSSNYFQSMEYTGGNANIGYISENYYTSGNVNVFFNYNGSNNDLAGFKTWLSTHNTELLYELAEEIIEPLTQNQATTMLDIIKTGSYEGTTNIYTDEDVKPTIGVEYYKKG